MITLLDLKKTVNNVLNTQFPLMKVHSNDSKEGFDKPGFFTQIVPLTMDYETTNFTSNKLMIVINYFNGLDKQIELDNLKMDRDLRFAFGMNLKVKERSFLVRNIRSEIVDEILQFRFDLNFFDGIEKNEIHEIMNDLELETIKE